MPVVLLATDADWIHDEIDAALADEDTSVLRLREGRDVIAMVREHEPDLVVLDLQIGNMGGMATCMALRLEEGAGRLKPRPVLMLLDRHHDIFLAQRSDADGWVVKPLDALRLRRAAEALLADQTWFEGLEVEDPPAGPAPEAAMPALAETDAAEATSSPAAG